MTSETNGSRRQTHQHDLEMLAGTWSHLTWTHPSSHTVQYSYPTARKGESLALYHTMQQELSTLTPIS